MDRKDFLKASASIASALAISPAIALEKKFSEPVYQDVAKQRGLARQILDPDSWNYNGRFDPNSDVHPKWITEDYDRKNGEDRLFLSMLKSNFMYEPVSAKNGGVQHMIFKGFEKIERLDYAIQHIILHPDTFERVVPHVSQRHGHYVTHSSNDICDLICPSNRQIMYSCLMVANIFCAYVHVTDIMKRDEMFFLPSGEHLGEFSKTFGTPLILHPRVISMGTL